MNEKMMLDEEVDESLKRAIGSGVLATLLGVTASQVPYDKTPANREMVKHPDGQLYYLLSKKPTIKHVGKFEVGGNKYITYFPSLAYKTNQK